MSNIKPIFSKLLFLALIIFYVSFFLKPISLTGIDGDLGRHLKSGELFFTHFTPATTNTYSYTYPDHPIIDHHWGAGVIFYLVHALGGFVLLHVFSIAVSLAAFLIFFAAARRDAGFKRVGAYCNAPLLVGFLLVPLIAQRTAVRPEIFSYLFAGVFYYILSGVSRSRASWKWLLLLPVIEIAWVNIHVYFLFGAFLVGAFLTEKIIEAFSKKGTQDIGAFAATLALTLAAMFINPFGARMVTRPFTLLENITPLLVELGPITGAPTGYAPYIIIFAAAVFLLVLTYAGNAATRGKRFFLSEFIIIITFGVLACMKVRMLSFFGFLCLPVLSSNIFALAGKKKISAALKCLPVVLLVAAHAWQFKGDVHFDVNTLGVEKGTFDSIAFFRKAKLKGPVFNNFKSGGLLIYSFFPEERVFTDQRLEAYPKELHDKRNYLREVSWGKQDEKYHFNVIFFGIPFKRSLEADFLTARLHDENWALVYADQTVLILVRNNTQNKDVIAQYRLN